MVVAAIAWSAWCTFFVLKWCLYQPPEVTNNWLLSYVTALVLEFGVVAFITAWLKAVVAFVLVKLLLASTLKRDFLTSKELGEIERVIERERQSEGQLEATVSHNGDVTIVNPSLAIMRRKSSRGGDTLSAIL